jgi:hypothetical protein
MQIISAPEYGTIIVNHARSPMDALFDKAKDAYKQNLQFRVDSNWDFDECFSRLRRIQPPPEIGHLSDIAFLSYVISIVHRHSVDETKLGEDLMNAYNNQIFRKMLHNIIFIEMDEKTQHVVKQVLKRLNTSARSFPGLPLNPKHKETKEEFYAMVGTPLGKAVAQICLTRDREIGWHTIAQVNIFRSNSNPRWTCLCFGIKAI